MKIPRDSVAPFDFEGLQISDYTSGKAVSSSLAEIEVPPGARHRKAYSRRSDKYYYVVSGAISFDLGEGSFDLGPGDVCIVPKGQRFSYRNGSREPARLVLVHTPSFIQECEAFEE